jgi:hypothetical protein
VYTTGTVELLLPTDSIALWLQEAFSATYLTTAYAGGYGYSHVFTPGNSSYTATVTTSHQNVLTTQYTGVRVNTFEIRGTFGEIVTASMGLTGVAASDYAGTFTPSYDATSCAPLHFTGATVSIAGAANADVKDFTFNINNNVSAIGTLRATRNYYRVAMGPREIGLSMTMDFTSDDEYDRFAADSEFAVIILLQGSTLTTLSGVASAAGLQQLKIELPRVKYRRIGIPINASDFISQDVECTVLKPCSATAIATVTLISNDGTVIPA